MEENGPPSDSEYERFPRLAGMGGLGFAAPTCVFVRENTGTFETVRPADAETRLQVVEEKKGVPWSYASGLKPWWFRTLDGATGIVQITGTTTREKPLGLVIRYKLVQPAVSGAAFRADTQRSVLEAELEQARAVAAQQEESFKAGIVDAMELQKAKDKVEIFEAQLRGDEVQVAKARLAVARRQLELVSARLKAGLISPVEFETAKGEVTIGEAKLRETEAKAVSLRASGAASRQTTDGKRWLGNAPGLEITGPAVGFTQAQARAWVEKRLRTEYPTDTYQSLEWGEPEAVSPNDWVTIRYKFIVSGAGEPKHYLLGHRYYSFSKTGDFVRSDYVDGPEVEVPASEAAFGPVSNGLQAAVDVTPGDPYRMRFRIRNASEHKFIVAGRSYRQDDECIIEDEQGHRVEVAKSEREMMILSSAAGWLRATSSSSRVGD